MTWCLVICGIIFLAIAVGCRVAYLESKTMPVPIERELKTIDVRVVCQPVWSVPRLITQVPCKCKQLNTMNIDFPTLLQTPAIKCNGCNQFMNPDLLDSLKECAQIFKSNQKRIAESN